MEDKRLIISENISALRRSSGLTQAELAEKINYSDKAVSKWERGDSIPDVLVLSELAEMFSVTVDYFLHPHAPDEKIPKEGQSKRRIRTAVAITACMSPLFIATLIFVIFGMSVPGADWLWKIFVTALPAISVLSIIFSAIWLKGVWGIFAAISSLLWSTILLVYVFIMDIPSSAMIFLVGVPLQCVIVIWYFIVKRK